jgi:hypothetical protein
MLALFPCWLNLAPIFFVLSPQFPSNLVTAKPLWAGVPEALLVPSFLLWMNLSPWQFGFIFYMVLFRFHPLELLFCVINPTQSSTPHNHFCSPHSDCSSLAATFAASWSSIHETETVVAASSTQAISTSLKLVSYVIITVLKVMIALHYYLDIQAFVYVNYSEAWQTYNAAFLRHSLSLVRIFTPHCHCHVTAFLGWIAAPFAKSFYFSIVHAVCLQTVFHPVSLLISLSFINFDMTTSEIDAFGLLFPPA